MPSYYIYLISSLPFLQFGAKAPITFERFLELCRNLIPAKEFLLLSISKNIINEDLEKYGKINNIVNSWRDFEFMLRNELVKIRAKRLHRDAAAYLRSDSQAEPLFAHKIGEIARQPSPLGVERLLDMMRWDKLEELNFGHYFDMDFLFVYAQKLLIMERWDKIRSADKGKLLNETLESIEQHARI